MLVADIIVHHFGTHIEPSNMITVHALILCAIDNIAL